MTIALIRIKSFAMSVNWPVIVAIVDKIAHSFGMCLGH